VSDLLVQAGVRRPGDKGYRYRLRPETETEIARRYALHEPTSRIGSDFGIPSSTVRKIAVRHGLTVNPRGQQYRNFTPEEIDEMARLWSDGMSQHAIGGRFGAQQTVISRVLLHAGFQKQTRHARKENHAFWKGGRTRHPNGYWQVAVAHDDSMAAMRNRAGYVLEHRLVMARALGRPLTTHETVHHINGDKADNRVENLQLRKGRHGNGIVLVCADCGSHNVVTRPLTEA